MIEFPCNYSSFTVNLYKYIPIFPIYINYNINLSKYIFFFTYSNINTILIKKTATFFEGTEKH